MDQLEQQILQSAEQLFDQNGFAASGMDAVVSAAGVSTRTVYKKVGSKGSLITKVLHERRTRFLTQWESVESVPQIFETLRRWVESEGSRGCLFLRAATDRPADDTDVIAAVAQYRADLVLGVEKVVTSELGHADAQLAEEILVLFEGAVSAASYRGIPAIDAAERTAHRLIEAMRVTDSVKEIQE